MIIPVDRDAPVPLSRQIASYLEELIRLGHLSPGARLPATRTLARTLDVARATVESAYEELAARRLVAVRPGRAATVRQAIPESAELDLPFRPVRGRDPFPAAVWASPAPSAVEVVDLAGVGARLRHFPAKALRRFHEEALSQGGPLFTAPPALGETALRKAAAGLLARGGVLRSADDMVVFASVDEAFAALVALFVPADGLVLVDAPIDPALGVVLRDRGVLTELLPREDDALARMLAERPAARLVVATTGLSRLPFPAPSLVRRKALLDAIRERHLPLVEDVTGADRLSAPLPPLASLDSSGRVLPLCDLADEVGGNLSAAVVAATPRALERWRSHAASSVRRPDRLAQRVLARALEWPHRPRVLRALREHRRLLIPSVKRTIRRRLSSFPEAEASPSADAILLALPAHVSADEIQSAAADRGVIVRIAADCAAAHASPGFLLLDLARHEEGEILQGIRVLGEVVDAKLARSS